MRRIKIPEMLKVLGHDYSIIFNATCRMDDGRAACGLHVGSEERIEINPGYTEGTQASTFLHEIIEAINWMLELHLEHSQISALEEGLYQVLKDNKLHFDE